MMLRTSFPENLTATKTKNLEATVITSDTGNMGESLKMTASLEKIDGSVTVMEIGGSRIASV